MLKGQLGGLMKQAQQMQENMQKVQEELAEVEVNGEAGAGMVKAVVTCRNEIRSIKIDPSLLEDDPEMLEDLVVAAINDGLKKAEKTTQERMGGLTAGMGLPPGFKMPF